MSTSNANSVPTLQVRDRASAVNFLKASQDELELEDGELETFLAFIKLNSKELIKRSRGKGNYNICLQTPHPHC